MSIIEIDLGNTRLKWRLVDDAGQALTDMSALEVEKGNSAQLSSACKTIRETVDKFFEGKLRRARVGSVRDAASNRGLEAAIEEHLGVATEFAHSAAEVAGVSNHYLEPAQMGVDRWLAIVGAALGLANGRACCVVDAGSAMTIDCVREDAAHLGGFILPGYQMQVHSLLDGTDKVAAAGALQLESRPVMELPNNTVSAVGHGVLLSLTAAVDQAIELTKARSGSPDDHLLIFTGGDAQLLASYWQSGCDARQQLDVTITDSLVLDGLKYLLP